MPQSPRKPHGRGDSSIISILPRRYDSGIYGLGPLFRDVDGLNSIVTLPQCLHAGGFRTSMGGKIYHGPYGRDKVEFDSVGVAAAVGARPKQKLIGVTPGGNNPLMDWGEFVCDSHFRLIRYMDGAGEFYDLRTDPNEFDNSINDPQFAAEVKRLSQTIPVDEKPLPPGSHSRILERRADQKIYWEGQPIVANEVVK